MESLSASRRSQHMSVHGTQANQLQSPLLRLPAELRNSIYALLFQDITIRMGYRRRHYPLRGALALLETCRQLHIETHDLFMSTTTFDIQHCNLMKFATTYGPAHTPLVKTLVCCAMDTSVVSGAWEDVQKHWEGSINLLASLERIHVVGYLSIEELRGSRHGAVLGWMTGGRVIQISTSVK